MKTKKTVRKPKEQVKDTAEIGSIYTSFEVKSKGYQETFGTKEDALKQAEVLKKRAIKNQESVNIKVFATKQDDEKEYVISSIKIDEGFFNN
jgi:hypothetical protein